MTKTLAVTTQVYRVYIKATPQAVWDAITKPEWTAKYGYGGRMEYDLRPGGSFRGYTSDAMKRGGAAKGVHVPDVAIEGGVTKLTLVHDLEGAPRLAGIISGAWEDQGAGGGWSWVLSDLKSLLETGKGFMG
jgi:hypothetical protein